MKFNVVCALLGMTSAVQLSYTDPFVTTVTGTSKMQFAPPTYDVTTKEFLHTKWDKDKPHPGYHAGHDGFEGVEHLGKYERQFPSNFQGPGSGDDQFMHSMIKNYAIEQSTPEGKPTGRFVFKEF